MQGHTKLKVNTWSRAAKTLAFLLIGLAAFLLLYAFAGGGARSICLIKNTLGIPCPGCGLTRAFSSILRGNLPLAFRQNILSIPLFLGFILAFCLSLYGLITKKDILGHISHLLATRWVLLLCVVLAIASFLYNVILGI
ncbi:DUF2752 domain-containing protein [Eubacteriales bacterium OttesenSCG-928-M02]|nr:DUF2752 domain-containing protein [Eubacteriales bacterium OttesenSCG-928-M02]